jgi:hypothetical protein
MIDAGAITLRKATPDDAISLANLAALDSSRLPSGPMLLAEVEDELWAALSLSDETVIADPFHSTDELIELLQDRAAAL